MHDAPQYFNGLKSIHVSVHLEDIESQISWWAVTLSTSNFVTLYFGLLVDKIVEQGIWYLPSFFCLLAEAITAES